ncbi:MAG: hypothetical protein WD734_01995 [Dehalococcoidia bacterium]
MRAPARPFHLTRGFVAFASVMVLPALLATAIVLGAWLVSDEVYAAETTAPSADAAPVAEWKTTLVGICPIH